MTKIGNPKTPPPPPPKKQKILVTPLIQSKAQSIPIITCSTNYHQSSFGLIQFNFLLNTRISVHSLNKIVQKKTTLINCHLSSSYDMSCGQKDIESKDFISFFFFFFHIKYFISSWKKSHIDGSSCVESNRFMSLCYCHMIYKSTWRLHPKWMEDGNKGRKIQSNTLSFVPLLLWLRWWWKKWMPWEIYCPLNILSLCSRDFNRKQS